MATVEINNDRLNDLTVFTVHGDLCSDELIHHIKDFYAGNPTKLVLWDGTDGSQGNIATRELKKVFDEMIRYSVKRKNGKTAFVAGFDVDYGIGRMYEAYGECEHVPVAYRVFRSTEEALQWLGVKEKDQLVAKSS